MITRMRLIYAYYLLIEKDEAKALKEKEAFEKACLRYPDLGEIKNEKALMEYIDSIHKNNMEATKNTEINDSMEADTNEETVEKEA